MAVQKRPTPIEEDLEATAELPVIEFTAGAEVEVPVLPESAVSTDVFPAPVIQVGVAELAESLREVEQRLQRKLQKVQQLESELAAERERSAGLESQLEQERRELAARESALQAELAAAGQRQLDLERELTGLKDVLAETRAQLQSQRDVLGESRRDAEQRARAQQHQEQDLADLRRRSERQVEALATWQGFRAVSEAMLGEAEDALRDLETRHAAALGDVSTRDAEADERLATLQQSLLEVQTAREALDAELATTREQAQAAQAMVAERDAAQAQLGEELATLRALEARARQGAEVHDAQQERIAALESELETARARSRDSAEQARVVGERAHRLEVEAHASAALLGNLQQSIERLGRDDTGSRPVLQPPPPDPVVRVMIRADGGSEIVYPVSKRTTVGRTPDNDIQVDTTFVSRHHAVLLSNPDHCIVEDLNSTNGVLVNGHRVGRQILRDGDMVTIGRTEFRYQQRS